MGRARIWRRGLGGVLILAAVVGIIFSLLGVTAVWQYKGRLEATLRADLDLVAAALDTTSQGLTVADSSLAASLDNVLALEKTISATGRALDETAPLFDTLITLTQSELPATITSTQTSLAAAQESAKLVDGFLTAISSIPFISRDVYNPPVPLNVALGQVAASLDSLPASLTSLERSLTTASGNLERIGDDIDRMAVDVRNIHTSLADAQNVIANYQALLATIQDRVAQGRQSLAQQLTTAAWLLTIFLLGFGASQVGLLLQGWERFNRPPSSQEITQHGL